MRIFLSGNEDVCRWHLPVAQAKALSFVERCEKEGLKQNTFHFRFEDTGATMQAQYAFGQLSLQMHAPFIHVEEGETKEEEFFEAGPKTFFVNTTQGYFWVEVRYDEGGLPVVILTPFVAKTVGEDGVTEEFVYPGFALNAPGMISGSHDENPATRYVLSQNGGVMTGEDRDKGTIVSTPIIDGSSRITVVDNSQGVHDFVIIKTTDGQSIEIRRVLISITPDGLIVDKQHSSVDMMYEGTNDLSPARLFPGPAWVHRKCQGSYFSPNKTIGYHVDSGTDDEFIGNLGPDTGTNMLDNTGGFEESLFNHSPDLYRVAELAAFPISVKGDVIEVVLVSPTMSFTDDLQNSKKCWGGYGLTQSEAGCVDYMPDFSTWLLAPRFVSAEINMASGEKVFTDMGLSGSCDSATVISSWDGNFSGSLVIQFQSSCDTTLHDNKKTEEADDQCAWYEACTDTCHPDDPGSIGTCPRGWTPLSHWEYFSRENLRISRKSYFLFGGEPPVPQSPSTMNGFYFMFDGLWHLDIGVYWASSTVVGNHCGLCVSPLGSQVPGENVVFALSGIDNEWALSTGREFVKDMEIVTPLGYVIWPGTGQTVAGFVAKVPEEFGAPHDPVMMIGGIEFPSQDVPGEKLRCQRAIMSSPCICEDNEMVLDEYSSFQLGHAAYVQVNNGCPPFEISLLGANIAEKRYLLTEARAHLVNVTDDCAASMLIKDACGTELELADEYGLVGVVSGPARLAAGESDSFYHNLGPAASYTGELSVVESFSDGAVLQMPSGAEGDYEVSWTGTCDIVASMTVSPVPCPVPLDTISALDTTTLPQVGEIVMPCPGWAQPYRVVTAITGPSIGCGTPLNTGWNLMTPCGEINAVAWVYAPLPSEGLCPNPDAPRGIVYFVHMGDPGNNPCG